MASYWPVCWLRDIERVRLPKIGEVVYQGLPMASITSRDGQVHTICSPLTGVVAAVNSQLARHSECLVNDPCGAGWIAEICATRDEEDLKGCLTRGVLVLSANADVAEDYMQRLLRVGCHPRAYIGHGAGRGWEEMAQPVGDPPR